MRLIVILLLMAASRAADLGGKFFGVAPDAAKTRRYYIAAEPTLWDFAPVGKDPVCGKTLPPQLLANRRGAKVRYVQYTDETFSARVIQPARLGILGPVLRGVVGEYLSITFLNRSPQPLSMHPHGLRYDKDSEGASYFPKPGLGAAVKPGERFTYVWQLDESSGPRPDEPSSKAWLYHSHVSGDDEINLGLVGFVIVTDPHRARADGTPSDIDREFATLFLIFDESGLGRAERDAAEYARLPSGGLPPKTWTQIQELTERGSRYAINGLVFGNLNLEMNEGERTRWYLFGLGSERDFHTAHWHGLRVVEEGKRSTDVIELLPASMKVADMAADNPGSWMLHCHVAEHMQEGMFASVVVHPRKTSGAGASVDLPFFGLSTNFASMRMNRIEWEAGADGPEKGALRIDGAVTVFEAFSVFTEQFDFQLGETKMHFKPNNRGVASAEGAQFRIRNSGEHGVVYGGLLEFTLTIPEEALGRTRSNQNPSNLSLQIGAARHTAAVRLPTDSSRGPGP